MFSRWIEPVWRKQLAKPHVHLVFGARQTGKSTPQANDLIPFASGHSKDDAFCIVEALRFSDL